jgi:coenzyme PQQ precursor peptide PqqA
MAHDAGDASGPGTKLRVSASSEVSPPIGWRNLMKRWKTPKIREIAVGCEINAYACATV